MIKKRRSMTTDEFKTKVFSLKDRLYRFSKRMLNDEVEAQDVVQDVLMKLWSQKEELYKCQSIEAFAMTMVKNRSLDKTRQKTNRFAKSEILKQQFETVDYGNTYEQKEMGMIVREIIGQLDEPQKTIIHLRDIEEYEFDEIAPLVNMNVETIRVNLSRARKKVREEFKNRMNYGTNEL
ncbi:MAG TPA: RNA polymerase subunit sigma-70 [Marinilabiliales bacterium]|nr:RNA polymerase subunit sigma-70 [Marinilabiliales bacterium]HBX84518.1 RNA polymerase subunit sigma-70 [Marinilabiliales bacterium]HBY52548.1 RNA polymerase subunit sigma-70 [Marinilabiliales bacterium]HCC30188.1 RNA polymerase subunit sigma-70 [Marinilabiliales bacterium]